MKKYARHPIHAKKDAKTKDINTERQFTQRGRPYSATISTLVSDPNSSAAALLHHKKESIVPQPPTACPPTFTIIRSTLRPSKDLNARGSACTGDNNENSSCGDASATTKQQQCDSARRMHVFDSYAGAVLVVEKGSLIDCG